MHKLDQDKHKINQPGGEQFGPTQTHVLKIVSRMRPPTEIKAAGRASWPADSFWNRINTFTERKMRGMRRSAHFDGTEPESEQNHLLQHKIENSLTLEVWARLWTERTAKDLSFGKHCHSLRPIYDVAVKPPGRCGMWKMKHATGSAQWETSDHEKD